jgi:hypothetical protein
VAGRFGVGSMAGRFGVSFGGVTGCGSAFTVAGERGSSRVVRLDCEGACRS